MSNNQYIPLSTNSMERKVTAAGCCQRLSNRCKMMSLVVVIIIEAVAILFYSQPKCHLLQAVGQTACSNNITVSATRQPIKGLINHGAELDQLPHGKHARRHLPHFIIIGVKKCGTRAALAFLNIHPDIVTPGRELHFFEDEDDYSKGLEWYRKQFPYSYPDQLTGEKTPSYYRSEGVAEKIYAMNSSIKLIIVVKEPVERAMSNYLQYKSKHDGEDSISFDEAVLTRDGEVNPNSQHVLNSDYSRFIDEWLEYFPLDQLRVVDGEKLITAPFEVMHELQEYLGVRQYITKDFFTFDEEKGFYCFYNSSEKLKCLGDSKGRPHPPIDPTTRAKLYKYFQPKNELFFNKIKRTFDWYSKTPPSH